MAKVTAVVNPAAKRRVHKACSIGASRESRQDEHDWTASWMKSPSLSRHSLRLEKASAIKTIAPLTAIQLRPAEATVWPLRSGRYHALIFRCDFIRYPAMDQP